MYIATVEDTFKKGAPGERQGGRPGQRDATRRDAPSGIKAAENLLLYGEPLGT